MNKLFSMAPLRWLPDFLRPKFDANQNLLHFLALCVLWDAVFFLAAASLSRAAHLEWPLVWEWVSIVLTLVGTLWIGSGVVYSRPGTQPFQTIDQLAHHVMETFAYASRMCLFGVCMIFAGFLALLFSKLATH